MPANVVTRDLIAVEDAKLKTACDRVLSRQRQKVGSLAIAAEPYVSGLAGLAAGDTLGDLGSTAVGALYHNATGKSLPKVIPYLMRSLGSAAGGVAGIRYGDRIAERWREEDRQKNQEKKTAVDWNGLGDSVRSAGRNASTGLKTTNFLNNHPGLSKALYGTMDWAAANPGAAKAVGGGLAGAAVGGIAGGLTNTGVVRGALQGGAVGASGTYLAHKLMNPPSPPPVGQPPARLLPQPPLAATPLAATPAAPAAAAGQAMNKTMTMDDFRAALQRMRGALLSFSGT